MLNTSWFLVSNQHWSWSLHGLVYVYCTYPPVIGGDCLSFPFSPNALYICPVHPCNPTDLPEDKGELNDAQDSVGARFQSADTDLDGRLDLSEFLPFIHPFRHEHMLGHLVEDQLMLYDGDQDGKISFDEFTSKPGSH